VKTLPEILHDVMILLADRPEPVERIVIARGDHEPLDERCSAFQIRLRPSVWSHDVDMGLLCEARSWLGEQWDSWREHRSLLGGGGFDVSDVLATDWRIIS
jgi:hypothetical protein